MSETRYTVLWADAAVRDLDNIVAYVEQDSSPAAKRLLSRFERRAQTLESLPARGRPVPELALFEATNYRELLVRPYRVVYRVEGRSVWVLAVLDGRRDLSDLLLWRLLEHPPSEP